MADSTEIQDLKAAKRRHLFITIVLTVTIAILMTFLIRGLTIRTTQIPSAQINKEAKPFTVQWLQGQEHLNNAAGEQVSLSDLKGRPIVLNFWASWCVSCRDEAREFERFWQTRSNRDVYVFGIAVQDTAEDAMKFAKYFGKTYMLGLDTSGAAGIDYGVTGVPETFIINRQGVIIHREAAPVTVEQLEGWTRNL